MKKVVTIGGGSGSFAMLRGLREYPYELTAIINTFDSGGSSGILRDEFGVLPPGDVRRALLALSTGDQAQVLRDLFNFRFESEGGLGGHNFGNLLLVALSQLYGGDANAIEKASELLQIKGHVLPVSIDKAQVHAILESGEEIIGETNIDIPKHNAALKIDHVFLKPPARVFEPAARAIRSADAVILCPGDLYSSIVPSLLSDGMQEALQTMHGKLIWVCNIMTKWGETHDYGARELLRYSGRDFFDVALLNDKALAPEILERYAEDRQFAVQHDPASLAPFAKRVIRGEYLSASDLARHDSSKIAREISALLEDG